MSKVIPEFLAALASSSSGGPTKHPRPRAGNAAGSADNKAKATGSTARDAEASGVPQGAAVSAEAMRAIAAHKALVQYDPLSSPGLLMDPEASTLCQDASCLHQKAAHDT